MASTGDVPAYSASPSAAVVPFPSITPAPSPTLKPTGTFKKAACTVKVTKGNRAEAPSEVSFEASGNVDSIQVSQYTYDFGDGSIATGGGTQNHTYTQGGTYTVIATFAQPASAAYPTCQTKVTLKPASNAIHAAACTQLSLLSGSTWTASQSARINVTGTDNKGDLRGYRIQADSLVWEQAAGNFDITIATPGAYTVQAWVKDTTDMWVGGQDSCSQTVTVQLAGVTRQPETGPAEVYWFSLGGLFIIWLGAELWYQRNHPAIG